MATDSCCINPTYAESWIDLIHAAPMNPFDIIANAQIGGAAGAFTNSSNFATAATWLNPGPASIASTTPICVALETDNLQKVADAAQWNFQHLTSNASATLAPALAKLLFLRGGLDWQMNIPLVMGGTAITNVQISFRDNAGTRGDSQGTIPVIQWTGSFTGTQTLSLSLRGFGRYSMGIRLDNGTSVTMYESEWMIVK